MIENESRRPVVIGVLALIAFVLAILGIGLLTDDDDDGAEISQTGTTSTSTSTTEAPDTGTTSELSEELAAAVFPYPETEVRFDDPVALAEEFAVDFIGFTDPLVGDFQQGDSRSGEVEIRPNARGPVTTALVRQLGDDDHWFVIGATTANIQVDVPETNAVVGSPVVLRGRAHAFEGTVSVEVREDGRPLGKGFVTGRGDELGPFEGEIPIDEPSERYGAVLFFTESAEDGSVWEAAVVRVRFEDEDARGSLSGSPASTTRGP